MCICVFRFVMQLYRECTDAYGSIQVLVIMPQDMISGFRYDVEEIRALVGYYTVYNGTTDRSKKAFLYSLTL